jgi:hypothetical protein
MKKLGLLFACILSLGLINAQAQQKDWAIGLRLGDPSGLSVKKYLSSGNALDISLGSAGYLYGGRYRTYRDGYRSAGVALMVNYLWQKDISGADGLQWYIGVGGMMSSRRYYRHGYWKHGVYYGSEYSNSVSLGATGIIGLEWFIPNTPISLFGDVGLYLEAVPATFWANVPAGFGGRFNF